MPQTKRPLKVFLCHSHSDAAAVRNLYLRLTKDGVDTWLDKEKLLPGQDWEYEIRKAVREADVVVVCLSKQFNQAGFRQKEVRLALDTAVEQPEGEIFIIPARLDECDTLESLRKWQWVDLFDKVGYIRMMSALKQRALQLERSTVELPETFTKEELPRVSNPVGGMINNKTEPLPRIDKQIAEKYFPYLFIVCMILSLILGGFLWNILNILLDWTFHLGGSGNEPYGFQAFIWGAISVLPIIVFAGLAGYRYILSDRESLQKFGFAIILYTIFGGIGAVVFYDFRFRNYVEALKLGYGAQELIIVSIWAFVISLSVSLPLLLLGGTFKIILNNRFLFLQIPLPVILAFLAVIASLFIPLPENEVSQLRGFFAAIALRLGLFIAMYLSISRKQYR